MYYPIVGSLLLMALWALLTWLTLKAFNIRTRFVAMALIVPMLMMISVLQLDEVWITINTPGYIFSQTLGFTVAVALFLAYRSISSDTLRPILAMVIAMLYPIFGFFSMLTWLMCLMWDLVTNGRKMKIVPRIMLVVALFVGLIVPRVYFLYWNGTGADDAWLWLRGLPELFMNDMDLYLWMPFIVASVLLLLFAITTNYTFAPNRMMLCQVLASLVLVGYGVSAYAAAQKPEGFRAMLYMLKYTDMNKWNNVVYVMLHAREQPTKPMKLLYNTAMLRIGVQPHDFQPAPYPIPKNLRKTLSTVNSSMLTVSSGFYMGQFNASYRWAMEHSVKFGKRVFFYKYMVRDAIAMGDYALADRYLSVLERTMFHRKWAKHYRNLLNNPKLIESEPEFADMPESINRATFL
jgi:hypothetical protein